MEKFLIVTYMAGVAALTVAMVTVALLSVAHVIEVRRCRFVTVAPPFALGATLFAATDPLAGGAMQAVSLACWLLLSIALLVLLATSVPTATPQPTPTQAEIARAIDPQPATENRYQARSRLIRSEIAALIEAGGSD